jgi:hypothetical protein
MEYQGYPDESFVVFRSIHTNFGVVLPNGQDRLCLRNVIIVFEEGDSRT